jgi:hypothetical protein
MQLLYDQLTAFMDKSNLTIPLWHRKFLRDPNRIWPFLVQTNVVYGAGERARSTPPPSVGWKPDSSNPSEEIRPLPPPSAMTRNTLQFEWYRTQVTAV